MKMFATKPDDLDSSRSTHMSEGKNQPPQVVPWLPGRCCGQQIVNNKILITLAVCVLDGLLLSHTGPGYSGLCHPSFWCAFFWVHSSRFFLLASSSRCLNLLLVCLFLGRCATCLYSQPPGLYEILSQNKRSHPEIPHGPPREVFKSLYWAPRAP